MHKKILIFFVLLFVFGGIYSIFSQIQTSKQKKAPESLKQNQNAEEISVRIPEGWNLHQISENLDENQVISKNDFLAQLSKIETASYAVLKSKPKTASLEGFLFPDTYRIFKPEAGQGAKSAEELINKALFNFAQKFTPEME